ncbi:CHRD domain-containing protein [Pedobacter psychrotolerans]|uniref:CHRD domain-containing protein n=2 Tax=Pedobacter psychrotolerans TaxID=1843235 RepID=A0A4R2HIX0_9SPHI|nr:CHRD domain-containing protein [Pedobacter psychrotolerans]GGE52542.1 hypothetical protein GCM10011413_18520 [Pedobacter psychrotolerans]
MDYNLNINTLNMKTLIKKNNFAAIFSFLFLTVISMSACKKEKQKQVAVTDTSYQVNSKVDAGMTKSGSKATATLSGLYSPKSKKLVYKVEFNAIEPSVIEFRNEKDAVIFSIKKTGTKYTSPLNGEIILNAENENALINQKYYIQLSSAKYPNGEIKGQLSAKKQ